MGLKILFSLDRYSVYTGSNYRQLVDRDGIVKSVWFRQVFSLHRVRFRQVSLYKLSDLQSNLYIKDTQGNQKMCLYKKFSIILQVKFISAIHKWET